MSNSVWEDDLEYAKEWYREGCDDGKKPVIRFMLHWIAFSWIYESYEYELSGRIKDPTARDMINYFCDKHYDRELCRFPAHEYQAYHELMKQKPISGRETAKIDSSYVPQRRPLSKGEVKQLLSKLYTVRCNLFHGSKTFETEYRDTDVVKWSAELLEGYLGTILG